jgi:hypothetical protein
MCWNGTHPEVRVTSNLQFGEKAAAIRLWNFEFGVNKIGLKFTQKRGFISLEEKLGPEARAS